MNHQKVNNLKYVRVVTKEIIYFMKITNIKALYVNYLGIIHRKVIEITGKEDINGRKYGNSIIVFAIFQTININIFLEFLNFELNNELKFLLSIDFFAGLLFILILVNVFIINDSEKENKSKTLLNQIITKGT